MNVLGANEALEIIEQVAVRELGVLRRDPVTRTKAQIFEVAPSGKQFALMVGDIDKNTGRFSRKDITVVLEDAPPEGLSGVTVDKAMKSLSSGHLNGPNSRLKAGKQQFAHVTSEAGLRALLTWYVGRAPREGAQVSPQDAFDQAQTIELPGTSDGDLDERERRFALVEVRPQQAGFRAAVFRACGGRCVISGCDVPEALEAAHLRGRDWRAGHNHENDGILLRRDLHTLYDRGLLTISDEGRVAFDRRVYDYYAALSGTVLLK